MAYAKKVTKADNSIWKLEDGRYLVELRLDGGYSSKHRKVRETLKAAKIYRDGLLAKKSADADFNPHKQKDKRTLHGIIDLWVELYANTLKDAKKRTSKLRFLADEWGNPPFHKITSRGYLEFRQRRLDSGTTQNTANHDLAYLSAMFNKLVKAKALKENPLKEVELFKIDQAEIRYLEFDEIDALLDQLQQSKSPDAYTICRICLETGCRISEAQNLTNSQVKNGVIQFARTKSAKSRAIPINKDLEVLIKSHELKEGRYFGDSCAKAFRSACENAGIQLLKGQATHIMRHTYAVHYMRDDGNILNLQKVLGHATITMTLRYAQFHPDYLADAKDRNPIAIMRRKNEHLVA